MIVTLEDIRKAVRGLGLSDRPLCIHSSLRSFGHVYGGAGTVVTGLLAEGCTVLVPSFTYDLRIPPPLGMRPARNGLDYGELSVQSTAVRLVFNPGCGMISREMGAIPATVVAMPGRLRGNHPINSFTAVGPLSRELVGQQTPEDVYAPLKALASAEGSVILMGVGLQQLTLIHLAEALAGRTLFRRWANGPCGGPLMCQSGSSSKGFGGLEPNLGPLSRTTRVGQCTWNALPAREALEALSQAIVERPEVTHCGNPNCLRCADAVNGGPIFE